MLLNLIQLLDPHLSKINLNTLMTNFYFEKHELQHSIYRKNKLKTSLIYRNHL